MATIRCDAHLCVIGSWTLLRLPKSASTQLPSRGMTMVEGTINGARFHAPSNQPVREATGSGSTPPCAQAQEQTQATRSRWRLSQRTTGQNLRCQRT